MTTNQITTLFNNMSNNDKRYYLYWEINFRFYIKQKHGRFLNKHSKFGIFEEPMPYDTFSKLIYLDDEERLLMSVHCVNN